MPLQKPQKAAWLVSIPALVGDISLAECSLNDISDIHNKVLDLYQLAIEEWSLCEKLAPYHFGQYGPLPSCCPDDFIGIGRRIATADNMVILAHQLYNDVCANLLKVDQVHIVSSRSGAILAIKFINFINFWGTGLYGVPMDEFDSKWNEFVVGQSPNPECTPGSQIIHLFRSLVVCDPALPRAGFLAQWLVPQNFYYPVISIPQLPMQTLQITCDLHPADFNVDVQGPVNKCNPAPLDHSSNSDVLLQHFQGLFSFSGVHHPAFLERLSSHGQIKSLSLLHMSNPTGLDSPPAPPYTLPPNCLP